MLLSRHQSDCNYVTHGLVFCIRLGHIFVYNSLSGTFGCVGFGHLEHARDRNVLAVLYIAPACSVLGLGLNSLLRWCPPDMEECRLNCEID